MRSTELFSILVQLGYPFAPGELGLLGSSKALEASGVGKWEPWQTKRLEPYFEKCLHLLIGLSLNGCVFSIPTDTTDVGNLYGKGKHMASIGDLFFVGKRTNYFAIDSDAFLYSDAQSVIKGDTEKIVLSESVYVLQRDGGYKQVEFREPISSIVAYWADDKMSIFQWRLAIVSP